ncbi:hypothetical protein ACF05T_24020 [Streptomyces lateritius]|uniref:NlpC/P60 domain-containing protein n=1 Tax=Streptomyces lateritius TaxID=67313 RepID=A0ABW6YH31_9ACTN
MGAATWAQPPTVTHDDWVRVLPAGERVLGKAAYGNPDAQGYLKEGSDFHDYMGLAWTFPTKTVAAEAPAGNLDCSGYVRMVYGFDMGVPMAAYDDPSGTRLPRTSRQMVDHSPGVRVAQAALPPTTFAPPTAPLLQPGDLVLFNADLTDDTPDDPMTPQDERFLVVDHVGICLGGDSRGARRFLSSRKTCDGRSRRSRPPAPRWRTWRAPRRGTARGRTRRTSTPSTASDGTTPPGHTGSGRRVTPRRTQRSQTCSPRHSVSVLGVPSRR